MTTLSDAVRLLESGDWQGAHRIVQKDSSRQGCWAHGIVHIMEGDLRNAENWYRRAERDLPDASAVDEEIRLLKERLATA